MLCGGVVFDMKRGPALFRLAAALLLLLCCGCSQRYTEADLLQMRQKAYEEGYQSGYSDGAAETSGQPEEDYQQGFDAGAAEGYRQGVQETRDALLSGVAESYETGYSTGYSAGYEKQEAEAAQARADYLAALEARVPETPPAQEPENVPEETSAEAPETPLPAEPEETQPTEPEETAAEVYITVSGKKYHRGSCAFLKKSKIGITLQDAKSKGYTPCSKCKPPQ